MAVPVSAQSKAPFFGNLIAGEICLKKVHFSKDNLKAILYTQIIYPLLFHFPLRPGNDYFVRPDTW